MERKYFERAGWEFDWSKDSYAALTVLRLLDMKETRPEVWERFQRLEDHNESRREEEAELWEYHEKHIVSFITKKLGLTEFSVDEVRGAVGKMFTNCGDLELSAAHARGCGYYPTYANMNHNCRANTKTFKYASDQRLEVRAQEAIASGQEISTQYVASMKATFARRPVLSAKWYFDCGCDRCLDPSELGSCLSGLLCTRPTPSASKLCGGCVLSLDPTCGEADWSCRACGQLYPPEAVLEVISAVSADVDTARDSDKDSIHHLERILHEYSTRLHPQHYILVDVKMKLAQILGNYAPYQLTTLSRPLKERKIQLCQEVLEVISIVDPGFTKQRGIMLSELNKAKLALAKQNLSVPENLNNPMFKKLFENACREKQFLCMYLAHYQNMFHGSGDPKKSG